MKSIWYIREFFNIHSYRRLNYLYKESLIIFFVLEYCAINKEESITPLIVAARTVEIHNLTLDELYATIEKMAKLGDLSNDGLITITKEGLAKLQSGQLKTEVAQLNMGLQNIRLQWLLLIVSVVGISVSIFGILSQ